MAIVRVELAQWKACQLFDSSDNLEFEPFSLGLGPLGIDSSLCTKMGKANLVEMATFKLCWPGTH